MMLELLRWIGRYGPVDGQAWRKTDKQSDREIESEILYRIRRGTGPYGLQICTRSANRLLFRHYTTVHVGVRTAGNDVWSDRDRGVL